MVFHISPAFAFFRVYGKACIEEYCTNFDKFQIDQAITACINYVSRANKYIDETQPWALAKDETRRAELASVMSHLATCLRQSAIMLSPVLLTAPAKLYKQLGLEESEQTFDSILDWNMVSNHKVEKGEILFPRLDASIEVPFIKELMEG